MMMMTTRQRPVVRLPSRSSLLFTASASDVFVLNRSGQNVGCGERDCRIGGRKRKVRGRIRLLW